MSGGPLSILHKVAVDVRPLRHNDFRRLFIGQGVSFIGFQLTAVAVPVQMFAVTGSSFWVGLIGLAALVPLVVFGLYGGAISDAVDRRLLYISSSCFVWAATGGLLLQALLHLNNRWLLLVLVALQTVGFAVSAPVRGAITPRILPTELVPAGNTLNFTMSTAGAVVGPLLAGLILAQGSFAWAYGLDAALFTVGLYAALRLPPIPPLGEKVKPGLRSVIDGLAFIATRPVLLMSFAVDIAAMVLAMPRALFPELAVDRFHDVGAVGWLFAAIAIGSVVAGLGSGWIGRVRRQGLALIVAVVVWGAAVALAGLAHSLWLAVLLLAVGWRGRPGVGGLPADDPADLRPGPDAWPAAGRLHGGRGRRTEAGRPAGRRDRSGVRRQRLLGRGWHRLHRPGAVLAAAVPALRHYARAPTPTADPAPEAPLVGRGRRPRPAGPRDPARAVGRRRQVDPHVPRAARPEVAAVPHHHLAAARARPAGRVLGAVGPQVDPGQIGRLEPPHPGQRQPLGQLLGEQVAVARQVGDRAVQPRPTVGRTPRCWPRCRAGRCRG